MGLDCLPLENKAHIRETEAGPGQKGFEVWVGNLEALKFLLRSLVLAMFPCK